MTTHSVDVAVIGAGTAGLAAESHARKAGASTILIDPAFAGTTCATVGCMPSKLLIAAADAADAVRNAKAFGIHATPNIDEAAVMQRVRDMRDGFAQGVRDSIDNLPDGVAVQARARFDAPGRLALDNGDTVEARVIIVATGAAPALPGPFDDLGDRVLTNEDIFELTTLPRRLGVIGGGPLGLEMAQAMHRLGVDVTLFDASDRLAALAAETSAALHKILSQHFKIHLSTKPQPEMNEDGVTLGWDGESIAVDKILVAAGRPPSVAGLEPENAGLPMQDGAPVVDERSLQWGDAPVFVAGDANAARAVLHEASTEGAIAGANAVAWPEIGQANRTVPLAICFCRPTAATIGTGPDDSTVTGSTDFSDQGRASVMARAEGLLQIHARKSDGRLVGASLCVPGGEHLAHLLAWCIDMGLSASDVLNRPFYHPTLEEGLQSALREICKAVGEATPWQRNDDDVPGGRACG
ncbi:MAG: dihydrolipoyl dehydrogenase [Rhodobacteraceae bacterium]|uniref:dihydrolipoyl dehydrogenase n=1 Tax=Marivita sp. TaxID=2003365 RepID=UPI003B52522D|nr:dihydrolipoyl dehydrogenase [Paracoccaceae bacterium]